MSDSGPKTKKSRIVLLDCVRGFTILSMVAFHACYDLAYLQGAPLEWFTSTPIQDIWRASISWVFLLLAGWMTTLSSNNARRAAVYSVAAFAVYAVTTAAGVDTGVSFGIMFCMAACTTVFALCSRSIDRLDSKIGLAVCLALFALTYTVPRGSYDIEGLAWLGLPSPTFASGDYYPLLPYGFMYGAGHFAARLLSETRMSWGDKPYPDWMVKDPCPPLSAIGRHSLLIYLLHQPLLLLIFSLA